MSMLCAFVLYQMCSYLLLISMADTVRDIVSRLGHWIQVLSALNPVDPLHNCMFENKLCFLNFLAKNTFVIFWKAPELEI